MGKVTTLIILVTGIIQRLLKVIMWSCCDIPRDRHSDFKPLIVEKRQTRLGAFDAQILSRYAKGMSTRDIVTTFKEMYDTDISATLVSHVTQAVITQAIEQRHQSLDEIDPIVYLDGIVIKVRQDKQIIKKTMYIAPRC